VIMDGNIAPDFFLSTSARSDWPGK